LAGLNGPPLAAELNDPYGVYYHSATQTIYVCDSRNKRVLKIEK
jgi:DNA-binding beta-propeller fold protein YncE